MAIKLLTKSPQVRTHSFEGTACCFPLCLAKQQCYSFLLHPNLCLWFQFSTTAQRLSFQHQYADSRSPCPPASVLSFYPQGHRNGIELAFLLPVLPDNLSSHCSQWFICDAHLLLLFPPCNPARFLGVYLLSLQPCPHSLHLCSYLLLPSTQASQNLKLTNYHFHRTLFSGRRPQRQGSESDPRMFGGTLAREYFWSSLGDSNSARVAKHGNLNPLF